MRKEYRFYPGIEGCQYLCTADTLIDGARTRIAQTITDACEENAGYVLEAFLEKHFPDHKGAWTIKIMEIGPRWGEQPPQAEHGRPAEAMSL